MEKIIVAVVVLVGVVVLLATMGLLLAFPIKWTWNYTMPMLFNLGTITWGQAWCLHFLTGCLIKATQTNTNN
ncbi:hypothetical protein LCGC14_1109580 [marine sediment metagenome]|uniref:Uncharacterized protein n=1 Tax=marine sediment metagenome TaxID=412755 RepID=A0A0F9PQ67_9ZZZZ